MNKIMRSIRARAGVLFKQIVFPESNDIRILKAVEYLTANSLCRPILLEDEESRNQIREFDIDRPAVEIVKPSQQERLERYALKLADLRSHAGLTPSEARQLLENSPLYFAGMMVAVGDADGFVAGTQNFSSEVLRSALRTVGIQKGVNTVSSIFLMTLPDERVISYGDCAVVPDPNAEQLAEIAIESAQTHWKLTETEPVVALLSFSTKGSAVHKRVKLVQDALQVVRQKAPDLTIDGEFQFDAAFVPEVARAKAPDSPVAGKANVFIFPNLDAGNIAYKITERLAGASATGPIVQGLAKPVMDLSRGCSTEDVINAACVCSLMGEQETELKIFNSTQ